MERLTPPVIPSPDQVAPPIESFTIPPEGIRRNALLDQWLVQMRTPRPEKKLLENELRTWSSQFGYLDWAVREYHSGASLMQSPQVDLSDPVELTHVLTALIRFIEPLSRYSAGWSAAGATVRPPRAVRELHTAIREGARQAPKEVRLSIITDGDVLASAESAHSFAQDQSRRHAKDARIALETYLGHARDLLQKRTLTAEETDELTAWISDTAAKYGIELPDTPSDKTLSELDRHAQGVLNEVLDEHLVLRKKNKLLIGKVYTRLHTTYVNRHRKGSPLDTSAKTLRMRTSSVRIDEARANSRTAKNELPFERADDPAYRRSHDGAGDATTRRAAISAPGPAASAAADIIDTDPSARTPEGQLYWEAELAIAILRGMPIAADDELSFVEEIAAHWNTEAEHNPDFPDNCPTAFPTGNGAAKYVIGLIVSAMNRADPTWQGK